MKKSQMIRKMLKVLRSWEGSRMEAKTAHELLDVMEAAGMLPPGAEKDEVHFFNYATGKFIGRSHEKHEWEPER